MKIITLLIFRNESRYLPGYFRHLRDYVDGFICFDDASTDNSLAIVKAEPKVLHVIENKYWQGPHSNQMRYRLKCLIEAQASNADFVLCTDADERYERAFLQNLRTIAEHYRENLMALRVRDIWDAPDQYRIDGVWSTKGKVIFFRTPLELNFPDVENPHLPWYPPSMRGTPIYWPPFNLYHLKSLHKEDRLARAAKFNAIDPERKQQAIGYDYLASDVGLVTAKILPGKEYDN